MSPSPTSLHVTQLPTPTPTWPHQTSHLYPQSGPTQLPISTPNLAPTNFLSLPQPGPTQLNFLSLPPTMKPLLSVSGAMCHVSVASTSHSETWFLDSYGTVLKVYKTLRIQYVQLVIMIKNLKSRKPARYLMKQKLHIKLTHSGVERLHLRP